MATGTLAKHIHRWIIGQPNGKAKLTGRCHGCGKTKRFKAAVKSGNDIQINPSYHDRLRTGGSW